MQLVREATSAMTNAHQILLMFPVRESSHAEGSRTKICLTKEVIMLKKPRPRA